MSAKDVSKNEETKSTSVADLDMKLEVVVIPVSDVDLAAPRASQLLFVCFFQRSGRQWLVATGSDQAACWARRRQHKVRIGARSRPGDASRSEGP
jgi:hypothetical protein